MNPLISIIVPVYKVEPYLDRCVQSIVDQTYKNLEILLVDDGSPDQCPQLCDKWAQRDARIRVIHKENAGVSSARNVGVDAANGDYLCFVDSDDYIAPSLCEKILALFSQYDVDIVSFDCCCVDKNGKEMGGTETICDGILSQEAALQELMQGHINHYVWNKLYRRMVFDGIRFPEGRLWEDMAVSYQLFLRSNRIYCCSEKLYYYCERDDSITADISEKALGDIFYARHSSYQELRKIYPQVGEMVFPRVALCALRLYDRSLWKRVDLSALEEAKRFLSENKDKILNEYGEIVYRLYFAAPGLYAALRIGKHKLGSVVKRLHKK